MAPIGSVLVLRSVYVYESSIAPEIPVDHLTYV